MNKKDKSPGKADSLSNLTGVKTLKKWLFKGRALCYIEYMTYARYFRFLCYSLGRKTNDKKKTKFKNERRKQIHIYS